MTNGSLNHLFFEHNEELPDNLQIKPYSISIEQWLNIMDIPPAMRQQIVGADVIALPAGYSNNEKAFAISLYDFMAFVNEKGLLKMEICCTDNQFMVIELCSLKTRLGKFFIPTTIAGVLFWGVLTNYIYDQAKPFLPNITNIEEVETPKFQEAPEVSFSIIMPDSSGNMTEVEYDGPVEGIDKVGEIIKTLTDSNANDDTKQSEN